MKKILITGATGFIGKHLYRKLKELEYNITGISFDGGEVDGNKITVLDITNKKAVDKFFEEEKFDLVFHLAAFIPKREEDYNLEKCLRVNGGGTHNLLIASKRNKVAKFVYSSSASVYNRQTILMPAKEEFTAPENIYGVSKLVGENLCEIFRRDFNIKTVSLRYASVYGFRQEPYCVLPIFIEKVLKNKDIEVFGSGKRTQDFIYVKDIINANIKAAFSNTLGVFNIGSEKETSILELSKTILKVFSESKSKIKKKAVKREDKSRFFLDTSKAQRELKFLAKYSLEEGLKEYKEIIYEDRDNC